MRLRRLRLRNHRNYRQLDLTPGEGVNVFIGPNGQGKTNLLEAVAMLALSSSPRARRESELVGPVGPGSRIDAEVAGGQTRREISIALDVEGERTRRTIEIDGTYPNYAQVIPSKSSTKIRIPTAELAQTVRAVSLFARDSANVIRLKAQSGALTLSATTNEVGDSKAEINADVDGSDIQIAFNARYVLDALGVMGEDEVELMFDGPLSPGLMRPPGKDHYLYVIMPVRVAMS